MHSKDKNPMPKSPPGARYGIVLSETNPQYSNALLKGSLDTLKSAGVISKKIQTISVPGSFEVPLGCSLLIEQGKVDAIIALGVLFKGKTPHFDTLCHQVIRSISELSLGFNVPIGFGIVMANNIAQAKERCLVGAGNKGIEAAIAAIKMLKVIKSFD